MRGIAEPLSVRHPRRIDLVSALLGTLSATIAILLPTSAFPQESNTPGLATTPDRLGSDGLRLGPTTLDVGIEVTSGYLDNVFATRNDRVSDQYLKVAPYARLDHRSARGRFELRAGLTSGRFRDNDAEDYDDWSVGGGGALTVRSGLEVFGDLNFAHRHEPRTSPEDAGGREPTTYDDASALLGFAWRLDPWSTRLGVTLKRLDFDDAPGDLENDDRDRVQALLGGRVARRMTGPHEAFAQGFLDGRRYDRTPDDVGLDRDSQGFSAALGYRYDGGRRLDGEVFLGYLLQDYEDGGRVQAPDFGARLRWRPDNWTRVDLAADRQVYETTLAGSPAYLGTTISGAVERHLSGALTARTHVGYFQSNYEADGRDDSGWFTGLEGRYYLTPRSYLGLGYSRTKRSSTDPDEEYVDNEVMLSLGAALAPFEASTEGRRPAPAMALAGQGYFVVHGSHSTLQSSLEGARGGGGSLTADFGDGGFGGGLVAGYGFDIGAWHLGLEAGAQASAADWDHARLPGGRRFAVDRRESYELAARFGYRLQDHALLYARAAGSRTRFRTTYDGGGFDEQGTKVDLGLGGGLGVDVNLADQRFVRAEYNVMSYDDNTIAGDNFANRGTEFRLGFGVRFGAGPVSQEVAPAIRRHHLQGFHIGVSAAHGSTHATAEGARSQGSTLVADYADDLVAAGVFAGYTHRLPGPFVAGVEFSADLGDGRVALDRDPQGRQWSLAREDSIGAAVRGGVVIDDRAILYAKAGVVSTNFSTRYAFQDASVRRDERQTGFNYGVGIEVPVGESLFVQLDYSITDYDSFEVDYGATSDRFDPDEARARLGVGWRF